MPAAVNFLHPIGSYYESGKAPLDYAKKVPQPMDFGTCLSKLLEGEHASIKDFSQDSLQVFKNCRAYWENHEDTVNAPFTDVPCLHVSCFAL